MEVEIQDLMAKIVAVPTFLGRHYFCKRGCRDFVEEALTDSFFLPEHIRRLKERDYITYKYVVKPFMQFAANIGELIADMMKRDPVYLALIWDEINPRFTLKEMIVSKKDHRQCHGSEAMLYVNEFGDVVVELGHCKKQVVYLYRREPGESLRSYLHQQYCPNAAADGKTLKCAVGVEQLPEIIAAAVSWPKARDHGGVFKVALRHIQPLLDAVVRSDRWDYWLFLSAAIGDAMLLSSVECGLSTASLMGLMLRLENLGVDAVHVARDVLAEMDVHCFENSCWFGQLEDVRKVEVNCPVGKLGLLELLYKEDPMYVYRFLKPRIEEELFKKS